LNVDRSELNNLADQYPDKVKEMENDIRIGKNVVWLFQDLRCRKQQFDLITKFKVNLLSKMFLSHYFFNYFRLKIIN
jgi:hypothetical protein